MQLKQFSFGPKWVYEPHENEPCAVCNRRAVERGGDMPLCDEHAAERRQYILIQQHGCYWNANVAGSAEITADTPGVRERAAELGVLLGHRFATVRLDGTRVYLSAEYGSGAARDEAMAAAQQSAEYRTHGWRTVPV